ncbi:MAG: prenyltransferase [Pseudomonadota bacterium]
MPPVEPTLAALANPLLRYFLATRPAFLSVTLFAALLGLAGAYHSGMSVAPLSATATVIFAVLAHAGINVLNDYYDELNGTDRNNTERIYPYTGGSRFIQNGVLTLRETAAFGVLLVLTVIVGGLWLTTISGPGVLIIGALGMFTGWAYSAPPLKLNSRGAGEAGVAIGFALIVIGADYVQRRGFSTLPVIASACYALLVTNILYINQFPDLKADKLAGKRHWVVRLGLRRARWGYVVIAGAGYAWLLGAVVVGALPLLALIALLPVVLSCKAGKVLLEHAARPPQLEPAIRMTIAGASAHGMLLAAAMVTSAG